MAKPRTTFSRQTSPRRKRPAIGSPYGFPVRHQMNRIESLPEEIPVAMVVNGISHAVMLATPADLQDFALGFCFTEDIINRTSELYDCEVVEQATGLDL